MGTSKQKNENLPAQITQPTVVKNTKADEVEPQKPKPLVLEFDSEPLTDINFGF